MDDDERVAARRGLPPGTGIGRYQILELLATGGMGEVYVARAVGPHRFEKLVALKRILPHLVDEEGFAEMFLDEARMAASLNHPNLVQVVELGGSIHGDFMTMELVRGKDLRALLRRAAKVGEVPLQCTLSMVAALASGLHFAHERQGPDGRPLGLVHRDVSPSNVLVSYDGIVKLIDFGVAKAAARSMRTRATVLKGKVGYMSPEQCRGIPVDRRSDVFSLGVLLYELSTLHRPFFGDNQFATLNRIVAGDFQAPSEVLSDYPPQLERIVLRAMKPDPDARYQTARDMLDDLERFAQDERLRISASVLADYVTELFGRPPPRTYEHIAPLEVSSEQLHSDPSSVVIDTPPAQSPPTSRTNTWLVAGLLFATVMSSSAVVIALTRDPPTAPSPVEQAPAPVQVPRPVQPMASPHVAEPATPPEPEPEPEPKPKPEPEPEPQLVPIEPDPLAKTAKPRRKKKNRGKAKREAKPAKPKKTDSIFPP